MLTTRIKIVVQVPYPLDTEDYEYTPHPKNTALQVAHFATQQPHHNSDNCGCIHGDEDDFRELCYALLPESCNVVLFDVRGRAPTARNERK